MFLLNYYSFFFKNFSIFFLIFLNFFYSQDYFFSFFLFDFFGLLFFSILLIILSLIMKFNFFYFNFDMNYIYLFFFNFIFVFSMTILIFSINFSFSFFGWEFLGISSSFLIFYYFSENSFSGGLKTVLVNIFGDCFFIIMLCFGFLSNFSFFCNYFFESFFFFLIIFTKSCQMPFVSWLPLAMSAPTPVSSLVHSSTLVTAGVYLFSRLFFFVFGEFFFFFFLICCFSFMFSSLKACLEEDMKKLIAFSTLSQISLMMLLNLIGIFDISLLYLFFHALFKALMFIIFGFYMILNFCSQLKNFFFFFFFFNFLKFMFNCCLFILMSFPFYCVFFLKEFFFFSFFGSNFFCFLILIFCFLLSLSYGVNFFSFF